MRKVMVALAGVALIAAPAWAYKLVRRGSPISVAKSVLTVTPAIDWNRAQSRPGRDAEAWTLDGLSLNEITFYGGIPNGRALFKEVNKREKPLPRFSSTMLVPDVVQLFESSYRLAGGSSLFTVESVEPATFAGANGFRFTYTFTLEGEEVKRRGEATGAIINGELWMMTYEAPAIYYFDRNLADYRALVGTATVRAAAVRKA